jgi:flagellar basal-body rod protein FlgC
MVAQRIRLETISANIANANTMLRADGGYEPYRRRFAVFEAVDASRAGRGSQMGVRVREIGIDRKPFEVRFEPESPYADERGYVKVPGINSTVEQINAMEASRAYEANVLAAETTKTMLTQALRLLA